uniref:Uncharacterized protein n=1 Tax=uncultured marine virus TaxID=186617 RepID=A0A0F7L7C2_9VIRU|nr:hypothetical protein [uncultured marine virus]
MIGKTCPVSFFSDLAASKCCRNTLLIGRINGSGLAAACFLGTYTSQPWGWFTPASRSCTVGGVFPKNTPSFATPTFTPRHLMDVISPIRNP